MSAIRLINSILRTARNSNYQRQPIVNNYYQPRYLWTKKEVSIKNVEPEKKKRTTPMPRVTLISPDDSIQVVTLDDAQKISKRRDLKLIKLIDLDAKTQRPVYKLMTGSEYHTEDLKRRELKKEEKKNDNSLKGEKILMLNSRISEHDLESRIKNIIKWIGKKYEVRVVISGDGNNMESCENVYSSIESKINNEGRFLQKRSKGNEIKFQIVPPKNYSTKPDKDDITL